MKRRMLYTTFLAHMVDDGCEMVLFPLFPLIGKEFSFSEAQIGLLAGTLAITAGFFQFITGYLSDYLERKKDLVSVAFFILALSFFFVSFGDSFYTIFIAVCLAGFGLSFYHPIGISVITTHFRAERGKAIGVHGTGGAVGLLVFPTYSGFLADIFGWRPVLWITAAICITIAVLYYVFVTDVPFNRSRGRITVLLSITAILVMIVLGVTTMCSKGFSTFFPVHLDRLGYSSGFYGSLLSVFLGMGIFGQYVGGSLADEISPRKIVSSSLILTAVFFVLLLQTENNYLLYAYAALSGLFMSIVWPALFAYVAKIMPENMHSRGLGVFLTVSAVMGGSSPIFMGSIAGMIGLETTLFILPLLALLGAVIMLGVRK